MVLIFYQLSKGGEIVAKIMSTHGTVNEVEDHQTSQMVFGKCITFKYPEPHSGHNKANHQMDNITTESMIPLLICGGQNGGQINNILSFWPCWKLIQMLIGPVQGLSHITSAGVLEEYGNCND